MNEDALKRIKRARSRMLVRQPFFGVLALHMKLLEDKHCQPPTMWTDMHRLGYNPDYVMSLKQHDLEFDVAHETLHAVFMHPLRGKGKKDRNKWLMACEHVVNNLLLDAGFDEPEVPMVCDRKYQGWSAEAIYRDLPDNPDQEQPQCRTCGGLKEPQTGQEGQGGQGSGQEGQGSGQEGEGQGEGRTAAQMSEKIAKEMKVRLSQAFAAGKAAGKLPAGFDRFVEEMLEPKVSWKDKLTQFLDSFTANDYDWLVPERDYLSQGIYLPSLHSEALERPIVVMLDTSASISKKELTTFISEVSDIILSVNAPEVYLIYVDAGVAGVEQYSHHDLPIQDKAHPRGGGGTSFVPGFRWIAEEGVDPVCAIYLTDMICNDYPEEPEYPVIWASTTPEERYSYFGKPPFGEIIHIDMEGD